MAQGAKGSTVDIYKTSLIKIANELGDIPLNLLTTEHFDKLLSKWRTTDHNTPKTLQAKISLVSQMFDWLVFKGYLKTNILTYYRDINKVIDGSHRKTPISVLSSKEHEALKAVMLLKYDKYFRNRPDGANGSVSLLPYIYYIVYLVAYETGMRQGEIAALKWSCVNLDTCTITVAANLIKRTHNLELSTPKTSAGYRDIVVSKELRNLLVEYKGLCGDTNRYDFVFCKREKGKGLPFSLNSYKEGFDAFKEAAGFTRPFRFHDIRHTNASLMIAKGIPVPVITARLGHSSVEVTYRTYAHMLNEHKEKYQAVIESL